MTERSAELAIADRWLESLGASSVIEIGAVTPYYWPGRVDEIIDPFDAHPRISLRRSLFDCDLSGRDVLAISTLEHIGHNDYGPATPGESPLLALDKIRTEAHNFLVTVPYGLNPEVDEKFFRRDLPRDVERTFLVRGQEDNDWLETTEPESAALSYGRGLGLSREFANAIAVFVRRR